MLSYTVASTLFGQRIVSAVWEINHRRWILKKTKKTTGNAIGNYTQAIMEYFACWWYIVRWDGVIKRSTKNLLCSRIGLLEEELGSRNGTRSVKTEWRGVGMSPICLDPDFSTLELSRSRDTRQDWDSDCQEWDQGNNHQEQKSESCQTAQ